MRKRVLAVLMSLALLVSAFGLMQGSAADEAGLRFRSDGTFKVLQIADMQDGPNLDIRVRRFVQALANPKDKVQKPDLIVLTGDNIQGAITGLFSFSQEKRDASVKTAIAEFMPLLEEAGVPIAVVFGNHDVEGALYIGSETDKDKQLAMYQEYANCVAVKQDMTYENKNLSGVGNYNLPILSKDGSAKVAYNIWLFDAFESTSSSPYDGVHDDVLDWYTWKSEQYKTANGGQWVPAVSFQHVIVPEIYDAMEAAGRTVDTSTPVESADYIWEDPCPNDQNTNQFSRMKDRDVKAMFFGHDHNNNFRIPYQGIDLICTGGACFGDRGLNIFLAYNRAHDAMARMITLHEDDPNNVETETLFYSDYKEAGFLAGFAGRGELDDWGAVQAFFDDMRALMLGLADKILLWLNWI